MNLLRLLNGPRRANAKNFKGINETTMVRTNSPEVRMILKYFGGMSTTPLSSATELSPDRAKVEEALGDCPSTPRTAEEDVSKLTDEDMMPTRWKTRREEIGKS